MIPENICADVLEATDLEKLISESGVDLKQKGANWVGCCPFHNEKTPSFNVKITEGYYYCFGCGKGGNAANYLQLKEGLTYVEAIKKLANKAKIEIPERELSEEEKQEELNKIEIYKINKAANSIFSKIENGPGKDYIFSRHSEDQVKKWSIGFAKNGYVNELLKLGYSQKLIEDSGLGKIRNEKLGDTFIQRVMYPIHTISGEIAGFTGRRITDDTNISKYINTKDTPAYKKSDLLYGLFTGWQAMRKLEKLGATLVEGTTDVITIDGMLPAPVAALGTSFGLSHAKILSRYAKNVLIIGDGDSAGLKMIYSAGKLLLKEGVNVSIVQLPKDQDPDNFFNALKLEEVPKDKDPIKYKEEKLQTWLDENKKDFVIWFALNEFIEIKGNPSVKLTAANDVCDILSLIKDAKKLQIYVDEVGRLAAKYDISKSFLKSNLKGLQTEEKTKTVKRTDENGLPDYIYKNPEKLREYYRYGFYEGEEGLDINQYYFGPGNMVSNFIIVPIFHVTGSSDNRKLFILKNNNKEIAKIDIEIDNFTSINAFKKVLEGTGNFVFYGDDKHFIKIRGKLYNNTRYCKKIETLGWQSQGFWAWANGFITPDDPFESIDDDGVIMHQKQHYYIPAFSSIYLQDRSIYTAERKFRFIPNSTTTFFEWSKLFTKVYGKNGMIGISFALAACFRDYIIRLIKSFPTLNNFGPVQTGKTQLAKSLLALFGEDHNVLNLFNSTQAVLAEHLQTFSNGIVVLDEYKNSLDIKVLESLKGIYDGTGRMVMGFDKGKSKKVTQVNSAAIICGQEMPTLDVALISRVIFLQFHQSEFTDDERYQYESLIMMQAKGLTHLINQLVGIREHFEENFYLNYSDVLKKLTEKLQNVSDRMLKNWAIVLASFVTVNDKIKLAINYTDMFEFAVKCIEIQQRQTSRSNEVTRFWETVDSAFDNREIESGWQFILKEGNHFITPKMDENDKFEVRRFTDRMVLKIKFNALADVYMKNMRMNGDKPLAKDTLKYYLENQKYFLGVSRLERFEHTFYNRETNKMETAKQKTSAYCFDYAALEQFGINLSREIEIPLPSENPTSNQTELPDFYQK